MSQIAENTKRNLTGERSTREANSGYATVFTSYTDPLARCRLVSVPEECAATEGESRTEGYECCFFGLEICESGGRAEDEEVENEGMEEGGER